MSYVLDALRRADAERHNGKASSLLVAEPGMADALPAQEPATRLGLPSRLPVVLALSALVALLLWWLQPLSGQGTDKAPATEQAAAGAGAAGSNAEPTNTNAQAEADREPASEPRQPRQSPLPITAANRPAAPILVPLPTPSAPAPAATRPTPEPQLGSAASPRPSLQVSGVTYSENPAHRMLIINGRVVQEGQEIEPGHTLESIGQRSAVIQHGATRYNVNY